VFADKSFCIFHAGIITQQKSIDTKNMHNYNVSIKQLKRNPY
jgi:hypothetical protein